MTAVKAHCDAESESGRLTALLARVMDAYRLLGERYRFLNRVPAREGAAPAEVLQLPATADAAATGDVARVRLLLARAARVDGAFRSRTTALIAAFNGASSTAALAATLGLDPAAWHLDHRDAGTALGAAPLRLKPGPPKSHGRALEKPLGSLKDLNRCTVECHCPYVCALFLAGLRETFIMWCVPGLPGSAGCAREGPSDQIAGQVVGRSSRFVVGGRFYRHDEIGDVARPPWVWSQI